MTGRSSFSFLTLITLTLIALHILALGGVLRAAPFRAPPWTPSSGASGGGLSEKSAELFVR